MSFVSSEKLTLQQQNKLLKKCIEKNLDLGSELRAMGLDYDALVYAVENSFTARKNSQYKRIDDLRKKNAGIPAVSFFSGAGGMDIGFEYAGFRHLASVDNVEHFCQTLRLNHPNQLVIGPPDYSGDIKNREELSKILIDKAGIKTPFEGVFHGGPPCQPFSIAANQRFAKADENFKRRGFGDKEKGGLLNDYIWFIEKFRPKVFLIENVPGLFEIDNGYTLDLSLKKLELAGYAIATPKVLNASDFGVPQRRKRLIVVGARSSGKVFEYPIPEKTQVTVMDALSVGYSGKKMNHETRSHSAASVARYMKLKLGQRDQLGRVDRLNPDLPSKTIIAGGMKGGGRSHLHPTIPRTLSVRESARLQTFPDNYEFTGPVARQFTQVGNAVPSILAFRLAESIMQQFFVPESRNATKTKRIARKQLQPA